MNEATASLRSGAELRVYDVDSLKESRAKELGFAPGHGGGTLRFE